jgi:hypothetical protein
VKLRSLDRCAALVGAALLSLSASAAAAAEAAPTQASRASASASRTADADAMRDQWVQRFEELKTRQATLKRDLDQALADYTRGRTSNYLRGPGREGIVNEIKRLEEEVAKADEEMQDFPDEARRAGALPGWFRDLEDAPPAEAELPALDTRRPRSTSSETLRGRVTGASARETASGEATPEDQEDTQSRQEDDVPSEQLRSLKRDDRASRRLP